MANTSAPFGFRQYTGYGSSPTYELTTAIIASGYATAIFFGDPVVQINTGYIQQAASSAATGNTAIAGIFTGCHYTSVSQKRRVWSNYWPGSDANGDVEAYIITDPNATFIVQTANSNTTATAVGLANIGNNIGFQIGTGNTATGISAAYADQFLIGTNNTLPFRILNLANSPVGTANVLSGINGNDPTTAFNYIIVGFNNAGVKSLTGI
jgi:hypothetical protein